MEANYASVFFYLLKKEQEAYGSLLRWGVCLHTENYPYTMLNLKIKT